VRFKADILVDTVEKSTFACTVSCYIPTSGAQRNAARTPRYCSRARRIKSPPDLHTEQI